MINHDTLTKVQAEATRFQAALDAVRTEEKERYKAAQTIKGVIQAEPWIGAYLGSPATAALRRASMDLTRALAEMRRGPNA